MARSTKPENYPPQFRRMLLAAYDSVTPVTFRVTNTLEARRIRMRLYAYINALDKQEDARQVEFHRREAHMFRSVGINAEDSMIILHNKNKTPSALMIEEQLAGMHVNALRVDEEAAKAALADYDAQSSAPVQSDAVEEDVHADVIKNLFRKDKSTTT